MTSGLTAPGSDTVALVWMLVDGALPLLFGGVGVHLGGSEAGAISHTMSRVALTRIACATGGHGPARPVAEHVVGPIADKLSRIATSNSVASMSRFRVRSFKLQLEAVT